MRFIFVSCVLGLASCATGIESQSASEGGQRARLDTEFTLSLGDSVPLDGSPYLVKFAGVLEDSRCPVETTCIWEGNARIQLELMSFETWPPSSNSVAVDTTTIEMNTSSRVPKPPDALGLGFEVRKLEPAPRADTPTTGYRATLFARKP